MRRHILRLLLLFAVLSAGFSVVIARQEQKTLSEKLIRLHVIANSDSVWDQNVKLKVRDAVLQTIGDPDWKSREAAEQGIGFLLPDIEDAANSELRLCGAGYPAKADLCKESYPTRVYPGFSLPAGEYLSLRVVIGEGKGKNWWCVVYPSICAEETSDLPQKAASAGFSDREIRLIAEDGADVKIKFKILEWLQSCRIF